MFKNIKRRQNKCCVIFRFSTEPKHRQLLQKPTYSSFPFVSEETGPAKPFQQQRNIHEQRHLLSLQFENLSLSSVFLAFPETQLQK